MVGPVPGLDPRLPRPLAERLAHAACSLRIDWLDAQAGSTLQGCLANFLAAGLTRTSLPWPECAMELVRSAPGERLVLGHPVRSRPYEAVFANAIFGAATAQMDTLQSSAVHVGIVVIPALLTVLEESDATGEDLLAALAVGYVVADILGRALFSASAPVRFRPTSVVGPPAAAAALARLSGLSPERTGHAICLAANMSCGIMEWAEAGTTELQFQAAQASQSALTAWRIARQGCPRTAPTTFDGRAGWIGTFAGSVETASAALGRVEAGQHRLEVVHKAAPACYYVQTLVQAALDARGRRRFSLPDVDGVEILTYRAGLDYPGCARLTGISDLQAARMSLGFGVAATLATGSVHFKNWMTPEDPATQMLLSRTRLGEDAAFTAAYPGRAGGAVRIAYRDGSVAEARLDDYRPVSTEELFSRLQTAATASLGLEHAEALMQTCADLGRLHRAADLVALLKAEES